MDVEAPGSLEEAIRRSVRATDWSRQHWDITNAQNRADAAYALAAGHPALCAFGNFAALVFKADIESVRAVNIAKGRPPLQVASVTTTREHMGSLFDWSRLPSGLDQERVLEMIDAFYGRGRCAGPFGFRGPAAAAVPDHLTNVDQDTGVRTVQLIAPGYRCPSNDIVNGAISALSSAGASARPEPWLAITSANVSSALTGRAEPAHYRLVSPNGIKADFGNKDPGFVIIGYPDEATEASVRRSYVHEPNSTTIIDFSRTRQVGRSGKQVAVYLARHGSLSDRRVRGVLRRTGLDLAIDHRARARLPVRGYSDLSRPRLARSRA
jgi:hypothetical protein